MRKKTVASLKYLPPFFHFENNMFEMSKKVLSAAAAFVFALSRTKKKAKLLLNDVQVIKINLY